MKYSHRIKLISLLLALLVTASTSAQQHSVRPGINSYYMDPEWRHWVDQFESPGREVFDRRFDIIEAARVEPGMVVADIGAGTGLHARLLADKVGPLGKVYAVDISRGFIENIEREAREQGLGNIKGVVNSARDVMLPQASIDLAITIDTYHHFEYPHDMLTSIHRALRPGGRLIVIDFRKHPGASHWVRGHVRADRHTVIEEISAGGFKLVGDRALLRTNYLLEFVRI